MNNFTKWLNNLAGTLAFLGANISFVTVAGYEKATLTGIFFLLIAIYFRTAANGIDWED